MTIMQPFDTKDASLEEVTSPIVPTELEDCTICYSPLITITTTPEESPHAHPAVMINVCGHIQQGVL